MDLLVFILAVLAALFVIGAFFIRARRGRLPPAVGNKRTRPQEDDEFINR
jgi:hypothetical protein